MNMHEPNRILLKLHASKKRKYLNRAIHTFIFIISLIFLQLLILSLKINDSKIHEKTSPSIHSSTPDFSISDTKF